MYIVHFKKYENNILVDAWTSEDYFRTDFSAKKWLTECDGEDNVFEPDATINNHYEYKKDNVRIKAEIKYVYEFLGLLE